MKPKTNLLEGLPNEIIHAILEYVNFRSDLRSFAASSKFTYQFASEHIWKDVILTDCSTERSLTVDQERELQAHTGEDGLSCEMDHHDDTPMIETLICLVNHPEIARKVRTITHTCHLPAPDIISELPETSFEGQSLSSDGRTIDLLRLAIRNLVNVHTLRLLHPHYNIGRVLLNDFFDRRRHRNVPIQRLWLESCELYFDNLYTDNVDMTGLESIRIRRLKLYHRYPSSWGEDDGVTLARMGSFRDRQDGRGSQYGTWHHSMEEELQSREPKYQRVCRIPSFSGGYKVSSNCPGSRIFDEIMYEDIPESQTVLLQNQMLLDTLPAHNEDVFASDCSHQQREVDTYFVQRSDLHVSRMFHLGCSNLSHLTLDWISASYDSNQDGSRSPVLQSQFIADLSHLRFPQLRSLQYRNTVTMATSLPSRTYLLHPTQIREAAHDGGEPIAIDFLSFLESHPSLICLAWPVDNFFPPNHLPEEEKFKERVQDVIRNLGSNLETLRLQASFHQGTEVQVRRYDINNPAGARHRFLCEFVGHMSSIRTIKIEGAFTRDEKREIIRGLHRCPLRRIIMIGRAFPLGNTWGRNGEFVSEHEGALFEGLSEPLEAENVSDIEASMQMAPTKPKDPAEFSPIYGWHYPMLFSIASYFADTITELKFCGFNGAVCYERPFGADVTPGLLHHLRHFHNLQQLVLSVYFLRRDEAPRKYILENWRHCQLMDEEGLPGMERYTRVYVAKSLSKMIRPYLSPVVLKRGLRFRACFCIGEDVSEDIFDLDMDVNEKGLQSFVGPQSPVDFDRYWSKLVERKYF